MSALAGHKTFATVTVGEQLPRLQWTADITDVEAFGEVLYSKTASRATNPHLNAEYASQHIYGGLTVDGNQTVDLLCRLVRNWLPGIKLSAHNAIDIKFPNPCRVGDTVQFAGSVSGKEQVDSRDYVHFDVIAENQGGKVVAVGRISGFVPHADSAGQTSASALQGAAP